LQLWPPIFLQAFPLSTQIPVVSPQVAAQHTPPWQSPLRLHGGGVVLVVVVVPHLSPGHLLLQLFPPLSAQVLASTTQVPVVLPQLGAQHTASLSNQSQSLLRSQGGGVVVVVVVVVGAAVVVVVVVGAAVVVVVVVEHGPQRYFCLE
jgi:hypothetical protein